MCNIVLLLFLGMIGSRTSEATTDLIASPTAATTLSGHSVNRNFTFVTVVRTQNVDSKVDSGGGTMPDIRAQVGSACLKKTSIPAITPSPPSTNTIDCANVEGALGSWTTSYSYGALAVFTCYFKNPVTVPLHLRRAPTTPEPSSRITITCPRATAELSSCISQWESYLATTVSPAMPMPTLTDVCNDDDFITATCADDAAALSNCLGAYSTRATILAISYYPGTATICSTSRTTAGEKVIIGVHCPTPWTIDPTTWTTVTKARPTSWTTVTEPTPPRLAVT